MRVPGRRAVALGGWEGEKSEMVAALPAPGIFRDSPPACRQ